MRRRLIVGFPFGGKLELMLLAGAAYFAWQHEQGKHAQPQILCPICLLNKIAPADEPPVATPPDATPPDATPPTPEQ